MKGRRREVGAEVAPFVDGNNLPGRANVPMDQQQHHREEDPPRRLPQESQQSSRPVEDLEWEEWDPSSSPLTFADHCLAGSFAGVAEHTLLYPLDTVKTCWQSQVLRSAAGGGGGCDVASCGVGGGAAAGGRAGDVARGGLEVSFRRGEGMNGRGEGMNGRVRAEEFGGR